jgi:hypothetical protein
MERENHTEQENNLENTFEIVRLLSTLDKEALSMIAGICNVIRTNTTVKENGEKLKEVFKSIKDPDSNAELVNVIFSNSHTILDLVKPIFSILAVREDTRLEQEKDLINKADSILRKNIHVGNVSE